MKTGKKIWSIVVILSLLLGMALPTVHAENQHPDVTGFEIAPVTLTDTPNCSFQLSDGTTARGFNVLSTMTGNATATVHFTDGTSITEEVPYFSNVYGINFNSGDLSATVGWEVGTYTHTVGIAGTELTAEVSVTIVADPIQSVSLNSVSFFAGRYNSVSSDGTAGIYQPFMEDPMVTIHYSDGTEDICNLLSSSWECDFNLDSTSAWTVGTYEIPMLVFGKSATLTVNILEDPVASVSAEPGVIYVGLHEDSTDLWSDEAQDTVDTPIFNLYQFNGPITVTYTDGTSITGTLQELSSAGLRVSVPGFYPVADWTVGQTYPITLMVEEREVTTQVQVKANPVTSVVAEPVTLSRDHRTGAEIYIPEEEAYVYIEDAFHLASWLSFTVTLADGTTYSASYNDLSNSLYSLSLADPQRPDAPMEPGQTYQIPFTALGHSGTFAVTVEDDGIASISARAQYDLYETLSGYAQNINGYAPVFTLTYKNGETMSLLYDELSSYFFHDEFSLEPEDPEDTGAWTVGTHNMVITIQGVSATFPVKVLENPVAGFTVTPKFAFVQGVHGNSYTGLDPETNETIPIFEYAYSCIPYTVELIMADGTTQAIDGPYQLQETYRASATEPILLYEEGELSQPGTYTVDVELMNLRSPQTITIASTPITSVTAVYNGTLTEGLEAQLLSMHDGDFWVYYPNMNLLQFTVTTADGAVKTLGYNDALLGSTVDQLLQPDQFAILRQTIGWTAGTNQLELELGGCKFTVDVPMVANTLQSITVKATKPLYMDWNAEHTGMGETFLDTQLAEPEFTLTYADGTTEIYTFWQMQSRFPSMSPGGLLVTVPGDYTVSYWLVDGWLDMPVKVLPNPVKELTVVPSKILMENPNRIYEPIHTVPVFTATFADGTVETYYGVDQVYEAYGFYPRWQPSEKDLEPGNNTVKVELFGHTAYYTFYIQKAANPMTKITARAVAPLYENPDQYHSGYSYASLVELTLHYADGTTKAVMANELKDALGYCQVVFYDQQYATRWDIGKHTAEVYYNGFETQVTVEVVANPYVSMAISGTDTFAVTLTKADGTTETLTASDFQTQHMDSNCVSGHLVTDGGTLPVTFYFSSADRSDITSMEYQGLSSGSLTGCKWLNAKLAVETVGDVPQVTLDKDLDQMKELVDEDADRVWLTVGEADETTLSESDTLKVQNAIAQLEAHQAAIVLDLNLYRQDANGNTNKVSQIPEKLEITIGMPQDLLDMGDRLQEVKIIRIHNGEAETLDAIYNRDTQTVTFYTDRFSSYTVSYSGHQLQKVEGKPAGCDTEGNAPYYTCSHCDKLFADAEGKTETTLEAVKLPAGHQLEKVEATAATETATGNTEHYKCAGCGKLFADAEGKTETTLEAVTTPKTPSGGSSGGTESDTKPEADPTNPSTGDTAPIGLLLSLLLLSATALLTILPRRKTL